MAVPECVPLSAADARAVAVAFSMAWRDRAATDRGRGRLGSSSSPRMYHDRVTVGLLLRGSLVAIYATPPKVRDEVTVTLLHGAPRPAR